MSAASIPVLRAEGLTKRYGATLALDRLDLAIARGEVYGFLGPNGAGKTTTIRLLLGLHRATAGRAELFGRDAWSAPLATHGRLAYVAGEPLLWPSLTGAECLHYLARLHGEVDEAYRATLVHRFAFDTSKRLRDLSKGNRQKVQLIAAFAGRPELLIMDEPTSGLDPLMEAAFRETVGEARTAGQTVFLSSHILGEVEALCDRVGILRAGRLVEEGTLPQLRHLSERVVEVRFADGVPDLPALDGVRIQSSAPGEVRLAVRGSMGPLIEALGGTGVVELASREPSLEELFLAHYGAEPQA
jgi:polyether ionophore transport system ATP-binding protein